MNVGKSRYSKRVTDDYLMVKTKSMNLTVYNTLGCIGTNFGFTLPSLFVSFF